MKILYSFQGTGNGHICRAGEIIPQLLKYGDVDILISGNQNDILFKYQIKYNKYGLGFFFGQNGGVDIKKTLWSLKPVKLIQDIKNFPIHHYNLIINDFEPIVSWSCKIHKIKCVGLSHQASFLSPNTPRPSKKNHYIEKLFKYYSPTSESFGFHFEKYDKNIYTPIIRSDIRNLNPNDRHYITVYLPAYDHHYIVNILNSIPNTQWEIFSKFTNKEIIIRNFRILPITSNGYLKSLENCSGLITGGGFEAPSEALFLGKKLFSIPMHNQYEQLCNAAALKKLGVDVSYALNENTQLQIENWLNKSNIIQMNYPNETAELVEKLVLNNNNFN